jgi:3-deoxy-D-manno-octulosonic-acid transferase
LFSWVLNLAYLTALLACAPLIVWVAFRTGKYREGYAQKLLGHVAHRVGDRPCVWIHAVSVGEVNLLATLIGKLRETRPDSEFVVSTTTKTGFDLARRKYDGLSVFYCPLDFSWAVRAAMCRIRPTMLVLAELELWPNLICAAKQHGAQVAIVNGRLSDKSFRGYQRIRPLVAGVLRQVDLVAAQNEETAERFRQLGATAVHVTGSLKFDGAQTDRNNSITRALCDLALISDDDIVLLAGSTQEPEEEMALAIYQRLSTDHPQLRLILVPRHPERFDAVARTLDAANIPWTRRSKLELSRGATHRRPVLLVDTVGELGAWWGTAHIAFVGGSFGSRGGQNMLEPAAYGAAVAFGPNTWNFRDIVAQLLTAEAAVVVGDSDELEAFVRRALEEPQYANQLGQRAQRLVQSQLGATTRTVELLMRTLDAGARSESMSRAA